MKRPKYKTLAALLKGELVTEENESTTDLMRRLRHVRRDRYLTKGELAAVCYWKSPRAIRHIESNHPATVKRLTKAAFATKSERLRLDFLRQLRGVSVPMASSILTLIWPERYGVIDIRVWQLLHRMGSVTTKPAGVGFSFDNWYTMLSKLRYHAKKLRTTVRAVERTLYYYHQELQVGSLYKGK